MEDDLLVKSDKRALIPPVKVGPGTGASVTIPLGESGSDTNPKGAGYVNGDFAYTVIEPEAKGDTTGVTFAEVRSTQLRIPLDGQSGDEMTEFYTANANNLALAGRANPYGGTILNFMATDPPNIRDQISFLMYGTNIAYSCGLNDLDYVTASDQAPAQYETRVFGSNGTSILTAGTSKSVVFEQSMINLRKVIITEFNRDIPFTQMTPGARAQAFAAYHQILAICWLPFRVYDNLLGFLEASNGLPVLRKQVQWAGLSSPRLTARFRNLYGILMDFPIYDSSFFDKLMKYSRMYAARKYSSTPGTVIMQDLFIPFSGAQTVTNTGSMGGATVYDAAKFSAYMHSYSALHDLFIDNMETASGRTLIEATLAQLTLIASNLARDFEILLHALFQCEKKKVAKWARMADYLPCKIHDALIADLEWKKTIPVYDPVFCKRFNYAPRVIQAESGASGTTTSGIFGVSFLPGFSWTSNSMLSRLNGYQRLAGLRNREKTWTLSDIKDIGIYRPITNDGGGVIKHAALTLGGTQSITSLNSGTFGPTTSGGSGLDPTMLNIWVDAIDGWLYTPYRRMLTPSTTQQTVTAANWHRTYSALSFSGVRALSTLSPTLYNTLNFPLLNLHSTNLNATFVHPSIQTYVIAPEVSASITAPDNAPSTFISENLDTAYVADSQGVHAGMRLAEVLAKHLDAEAFVFNVVNTLGERQIPLWDGFVWPDAQWYSLPLSILDAYVQTLLWGSLPELRTSYSSTAPARTDNKTIVDR